MPVMRCRLRAHAVEWHMAPAAHIDARHRSGFLELQRRCNNELCRHAALTRNTWLDRIEKTAAGLETLLPTLQQLAIFLRQLALAREHHTLLLSEGHSLPESDSGTAVVICFDENGVPWCTPLPVMGLGDPYVFSERLHDWWSAWLNMSPHMAPEWGLQQAWPATRKLCELIERNYNADDLSTGLGVLLGLENGISTDIWQRLGRNLRQRCDSAGVIFPDAGFFPVAETHARLQARHGLYLVEAASVHDALDTKRFFLASQQALEALDALWHTLAQKLPLTH
ncbi:MAG: hypothetical protein PSX71_14185 [bacterium]|nr:hypothetical protein [bacterium]